jgi:hypothetical protein
MPQGPCQENIDCSICVQRGGRAPTELRARRLIDVPSALTGERGRGTPQTLKLPSPLVEPKGEPLMGASEGPQASERRKGLLGFPTE